MEILGVKSALDFRVFQIGGLKKQLHFNLFLHFVYKHRCATEVGVHVEAREQLLGVSTLLPSGECWGADLTLPGFMVSAFYA